ncbi:MAG: hypothetical protein WBX15_12095 [Thermoanaerobaculia bacterium]
MHLTIEKGEPGSRALTLLLIATTAVVGISRFAAAAATPWDWDEIQFMSGVRNFDVTLHQPHPPGYPLFIALGKLFRLVTPSDFRALQSVVLLCAIALFPALYFLFRSAGARVSTAWGGAVITAFFPTVWFFGGTGFSDVPSMVLIALAAGLLISGRERPSWFVWGALVASAAIAVRPQNILVAAVPFVWSGLALIRKGRTRLVLAALLLAAIPASVAYAGAALASRSVGAYFEAVRIQSEYVRNTDAIWGSAGISVGKRVADALVLPYGLPRNGSLLLTLLVLVALTRAATRPGPLRILSAVFGLNILLTIICLDPWCFARYSLGYIPMFGFAIAEGLQLLFARVNERLRISSYAAAVLVFAAAAGAEMMPPLHTVRTTASPPVAAAEWIRSHARQTDAVVLVSPSIRPFADYLLDDFHRVSLRRDSDASLVLSGRRKAYLYAESPRNLDSIVFRRAFRRLDRITRRRRFFSASVAPLSQIPQFAEGFWPVESTPTETWVWMSSRGRVLFPHVSGRHVIHLEFWLPEEAMKDSPVIRLRFNGHPLESITPHSSRVSAQYVVDGTANGPNELEIETSTTIVPARVGPSSDHRALGLRFDFIGWERAPQSPGGGAASRPASHSSRRKP